MSDVAFRLEGELFSIPAHAVEEIVEEASVRALPGLPPHLAGVLRHRGRWTPVVDAGPLLGLPARRRADTLILRRGPVVYALAVDAVAGVAGDLPPGALVTPLDPDSLFDAGIPAGAEEAAMPSGAAATPLAAVLFRLDRDEFGIEIDLVHEVLDYRVPAAVPRAPEFVEGVIEVRGAVLPVVDLRARLGLPPAAASEKTRVIVTTVEGERVGLVVDEVSEVARIAADQLAPPPRVLRGLAGELLLGVARLDERTVLLLRVDRILDAEERLQLVEAEGWGGG